MAASPPSHTPRPKPIVTHPLLSFSRATSRSRSSGKEADMGRCTVIRWACAAGVLCCWGCTAPKSFSPFGWMPGSNSTQTAAAKDPANPLKPADSSSSGSSTASGDSATASGTSADSSKAAGGSGYKSAQLDPALRKLMEDELQHETPAERDRLMAEWSKFD